MSDPRVYNSGYELALGLQIAQAYDVGNLQGWAGDAVARAAFKVLGNNFYSGMPDDLKKATAGKKMFLYRATRLALGQDTKNYPQQIGDCVSFGAKNATEYVSACDIAIRGQREKWRPIFPPYYYGSGRVYVGGGQMGNSDGSTGAWMAEAVMKYGTLFADESSVPQYAGNIAKQWGGTGGSRYLDPFKATAQKYLVKSAAQIRNWEDLVAAICNGYPCTVASNQGFQMETSADGFHSAQGSWAHQMCIVGVDDEYSEKYALILNSWGDVHGHLKSLDSEKRDEDLPIGVLRVKRSTIERMINAGETFSFSQFDGFPAQDLEKALFKVI